MKADKMDEYWRIQWGIAVANDRGDVGRELELRPGRNSFASSWA